ncbi:hypothetical protein STEG23_027557, partial [Scotinomys teguina]
MVGDVNRRYQILSTNLKITLFYLFGNFVPLHYGKALFGRTLHLFASSGSTETNCFWRIKYNEEDDGDLRNDCEFLLLLFPEPAEEDFYNTLIDF